MGEEKSGSFIPKRNPIRKSRQGGSKQLFIFTIISYVSLFGAVVAAAGVFFYSQYTDKLLVDEVIALDDEIANFEDSEMQAVLSFENRLKQAAYRFNHSMSVRSIFAAIEAATITTVQFNNFSLERVADESYTLTADLRTDSFDSALYQRGVLERNPQIGSVLVSNVVSGVVDDPSGGATTVSALTETTDGVKFTANLTFAMPDIPLEIQASEALLNAPVINSPNTATSTAAVTTNTP